MKEYELSQLRNVGILAHGGAGKTSLVEAILFDTGETNRLGKVDDGSSNMDYDPDEIKRKISINSTLAFCEWEKHKINIVDTPGYANFFGDTKGAARAIDGAVIIISAISGVKVQTEKVWNITDEFEIPRIVFINKMDRERANFARAVGDIEKIFNCSPVLIQLPIGAEEQFKGVIDLINMKALVYKNDLSGKFEKQDIPSELTAEADKYREKLVEAVVETDDEMLEKYLDGVMPSNEEIQKGLKMGVLTHKFVPVFFGAGIKNIGIQPLLNAMTSLLPSPLEKLPIKGINPKTNQEETRQASTDEPFSALVFKTVADPYAGKLSLFRICSGKLFSDSGFYNSTKKNKERFGQIYFLQGKTQKAVAKAQAGDLVAVAKLKETNTGDTLCDENHPILFKKIDFPKPVISFALEPKSKGDEEKIGSALHRLAEEDPTLQIHRNKQTKEMILSGMGQVHLEVIIGRLKKKFGVEVIMKTPKVPYKETIQSSTKIQGKYKKQSGGRGQYGDTWLEIEPLPSDTGFEFVNKIVGGAIPKQYIPAVEKGIIEAMTKGPTAGYPVVDVKVTLYDGSFHSVDSSEMAFKIAASMGFKKGLTEAKPTLLEPIMDVEITIPEDNMGDIIGDLNARRGKVLGVTPQANSQLIKAQVPMAEMLKYAPDLKSITGGRGMFSMEFSHYENLPSHLAEKIIVESKND